LPYNEIDALLNAVDAVVICLPNIFHAEFAEKTLTAGKHTLVEYPPAMDMKTAVKLKKLALDNDCVLMAGNTIIHEATYVYLRKNLHKFGKIVSASSRVALYSSDLADSWYMQRDCIGNVFVSFLYHHVELYKHLIGNVEWLLAQDQSVPADKSGCLLSMAGGTLFMGHKNNRNSCIQWYLSSQGNGLPRGLWLNGTKESCTLVSGENNKTEVFWSSGRSDIIDDDWGVTGSCSDFVQAINGNMNYKKRVKEDFETLEICAVANKSAEKKMYIESMGK